MYVIKNKKDSPVLHYTDSSTGITVLYTVASRFTVLDDKVPLNPPLRAEFYVGSVSVEGLSVEEKSQGNFIISLVSSLPVLGSQYELLSRVRQVLTLYFSSTGTVKTTWTGVEAK